MQLITGHIFHVDDYKKDYFKLKKYFKKIIRVSKFFFKDYGV